MVSLFEYLGKPAGGQLGKQVYEAAKTNKVKTSTREVMNKKYSGKVMIYPKEFLDQYFNEKSNNDLPF